MSGCLSEREASDMTFEAVKPKLHSSKEKLLSSRKNSIRESKTMLHPSMPCVKAFLDD